jgi:ubiquinone/menaquinone biosynthesis C-methylase UbiE
LFVNFLGWGKELEAFFRKSNYLKPNTKILDAGCGTGIVTRDLNKLAIEKNLEGITFHAFDLTQGMLDIFQAWVTTAGATNIESVQADVLEIETLPPTWKEYDLVVTSTMLEYLPKDKVEQALRNLSYLLKDGGTLLVLITKRNLLTRLIAGKWWKTNTYKKNEIQKLLQDAGFCQTEFKKFSASSWWSSYIIVVEAEK